MEWDEWLSLIRDLGIPAMVTGLITLLVNAAVEARRRSSKAALLEWLSQPSIIDAFEGDLRTQQALQELRQALIFERAFGVRVEANIRDELVQFANKLSPLMAFGKTVTSYRLLSECTPGDFELPSTARRLRFLRFAYRWSFFVLIPFSIALCFLGIVFLFQQEVIEWLFFSLTAILGIEVAGKAASKMHEVVAMQHFIKWRMQREKAPLHDATDQLHEPLSN